MKELRLSSNGKPDGWTAGNKFIGEKILLARNDSGDDPEDIAGEVGVSIDLYLSWECGVTCPTPEQLERVARYHGLSTADLLELRANSDKRSYFSGKSFIGDIMEEGVEASFRKRLVWLMITHNYTPDSLADRLGVAPATIELWCVGAVSPQLDSLVNIARVFDVTVADLVA